MFVTVSLCPCPVEAPAKDHRLGLKDRNAFSPSSGGWPLKSGVDRAAPPPSGASFPLPSFWGAPGSSGLWLADSSLCLCLHVAPPVSVCLCPNVIESELTRLQCGLMFTR